MRQTAEWTLQQDRAATDLSEDPRQFPSARAAVNRELSDASGTMPAALPRAVWFATLGLVLVAGSSVSCMLGAAETQSPAGSQRDGAIVLAAAQGEPGKKAAPVEGQVFLSVDRLPAGKTVPFAIKLVVAKGWHINANPAIPDFMIPTEVTLKSSAEVTIKQVVFPKGKLGAVAGIDEKVSQYEGEVLLRGDLIIPEEAGGSTDKLEFAVRYQACNDKGCQTPKTIKLVGEVQVAQPGEAVKPINDSLFASDAKKK